MIAKMTGKSVCDVKNVVVWGNHSSTQYPDVNFATVGDKSVREAINDDNWLDGDFIKKVQNRGAEIIETMGKSSASSAANAICDHVHDWLIGTRSGQVVSMGVISDGNPYNVPEGLIFSFPVEIKAGGEWNFKLLKNDLPLDKDSLTRLTKTAEELCEERNFVQTL